MPSAASAETGGAGEVGEPPAGPIAVPAGSTPFDRQGMWIWYIDKSEGGSLPRIIAKAQRYGIGTLYVKSGDGGSVWSQFTTSMVETFHQAGIDVCAWQFVYGDSPVAEAKVGAASVARGADCLVIDAEGDYEGKYASADRYIRALRARIGADYPLSLAGLPLRRLPPVLPLLGLLRPGRRHLQPAADVLEGDRNLGARRLRAHLPLQPPLGPPGLPARADLRRRRAQVDPALPPLRGQLREPGAELVGLAGDDDRRLAGRRRGQSPNPSSATARSPRTRCSRAAARATSWSGPRSTCARPASRSR